MIKKKKDKSLPDQSVEDINKQVEEEVKQFFDTNNMIYSVKLNNGHEFYAALFNFDENTSCWIFENPLVSTFIDGIITLSRYEPFSILHITTVKDVDVATMTVCNPVFTKYYWTSLKFIQKFVDMQTDLQTMEMQKNLMSAFSADPVKFNEAMKKYKIKSSDFNQIPF